MKTLYVWFFIVKRNTGVLPEGDFQLSTLLYFHCKVSHCYQNVAQPYNKGYTVHRRAKYDRFGLQILKEYL